jgi:hypothetical protein
MTKLRTYSELSKYKTFEERFNYLKLNGELGSATFGYDRYVNQALYNSPQWKLARNRAIIRDNGCDLGVEGHELPKGLVLVHHMNPLTLEEVNGRDTSIFDLEFLICTMKSTHTQLHYGANAPETREPITRRPNDTTPWKH